MATPEPLVAWLKAAVVGLLVILIFFFLFEMSGYRKAARDFINACTEAGGTVVQSSHRTPMQCFDPAGNLIPIY